ncbi:hypothetical protein ACOMHN_038931 [Nucella lapillus]
MNSILAPALSAPSAMTGKKITFRALKLIKTQSIAVKLTKTQSIAVKWTKTQSIAVKLTKTQSIAVKWTKTQSIAVKLLKPWSPEVDQDTVNSGEAVETMEP